MLDTVSNLDTFEASLGVYKKHFIVSNNDSIFTMHFPTMHFPWQVSRNMFGVILEENLGYMEQSGVIALYHFKITIGLMIFSKEYNINVGLTQSGVDW